MGGAVYIWLLRISSTRVSQGNASDQIPVGTSVRDSSWMSTKWPDIEVVIELDVRAGGNNSTRTGRPPTTRKALAGFVDFGLHGRLRGAWKYNF